MNLACWRRGVPVSFAAILTFSVASGRAECVDYGRFPSVAGTLDQPAVQFESLDAGHLVAITATGALVVLDMTDAAAPVVTWSTVLDSRLADLAICGTIAYCNDAYGPVHAVDLADPSSPVDLGIIPAVGEPSGIDGQGDILGAVYDADNWSLYAITDPSEPQLIHAQASETMPYDLELDGQRAILAGNGWEVQDITDPAAPVAIAAEAFPYHNSTWFAEGATVVGCALRGTTLVQYINAWARYGDYIHTTRYMCNLGLRTVDLADPAAPVVTFQDPIGTTDVWPSSLETAFATVDDLVLVGWNGARLYAWDQAAHALSHAATIPSDRVGRALAARDGHIYGADDEGLVVFAYPDPVVANVALLELAPEDADINTAEAVAGDGWFATTAWWEHDDGMQIVVGGELRIYATASSLTAAVLQRGGQWRSYSDVAAAGTRLYVVEDDDLLAFDLSDPDAPAGPATIPLEWHAAEVAPGPEGFVAVSSPYGLGVFLYDVADPAHPVVLASLPSLVARDLLWQGDVLFAATETGIALVDVAVPAAPHPLAALGLGETTRLAPAGDGRILAGGEGTVWLVDAADPHAPAIAAMRDGIGPITGFVALDGTVYAGNGGVHALGGATLADIGVLATVPAVGPLITVDGALLGCRRYGLGAAEVPAHCTEVAVDDPGPDASSPPAAAVSLTAAPNPFNPRTEVRFTTSRPGPARLAAYDLRGRLVRTLATGPLASGLHAIAWDGRDDTGRALSSGPYLLRLDTAEQTCSAKVTLLE